MLRLSVPQDGVPISAEAFLLSLGAGAQGDATGQLDSETRLTRSGRVFSSGETKIPVLPEHNWYHSRLL